MFIVSKSASYHWPVSVSVPKDGGKFERQTFDAQFKRVPQSHIHKLLAGAEDGSVTDAKFCREVMIGWRGIQDSEGQDVPFSETSLEEILDLPQVAKEIVLAYMESIAGAPRKN